ncbi:MAG: hypothetical protein ACXW3T_14175, partial [Rhodoplanes sp.]
DIRLGQHGHRRRSGILVRGLMRPFEEGGDRHAQNGRDPEQPTASDAIFVTPSHVVAQIIAAVDKAAAQGLALPLVYNTDGYDSPEALALLDGVIDIYMPDMKYGDSELAHRYSHVRDYVRVNHAAVREMHRQVGDLEIDERGLARRGLLVRHLVLPNRIAGSEEVVRFLAEEISPNTYLNLMDQYRPCYRADDYPELDRPITKPEFGEALDLANRYGLRRVDDPD